MSTFDNIKFAVMIVSSKSAGKGTAAKVLRERAGAFVTRHSDVIRAADILRAQGKELSRELLVLKTAEFLRRHSSRGADLFDAKLYAKLGVVPPTAIELQDTADELRKDFGSAVLTEVILEVANLLGKSFVVIDGMRNPAELEPLKKSLRGRFVLLGITADDELRKKWFLESRKRVGDEAVSSEMFRQFDAREMGEGEPPHGQQIAKCLALVKPGNMIANNSTKEALTVAVLAWFSKYADRLKK